MTFVDAGANVGLYSVVAGHRVGPAGRVLAFEPQAHLAPLFRENLQLNGLANVVLESVGLGSAAGVANLYQVTEHDVQGTLRLRADERSMGEVQQVPVRTLAVALRDRGVVLVDGMKIDVEGAELDVLRGGAEWLAATPPRFILFECFDALLRRFNDRSADLIAFLRDRGYTIFRQRRARWAPLGPDGAGAVGDLLALRAGIPPDG
jgi:FkbM family methyltransferase